MVHLPVGRPTESGLLPHQGEPRAANAASSPGLASQLGGHAGGRRRAATSPDQGRRVVELDLVDPMRQPRHRPGRHRAVELAESAYESIAATCDTEGIVRGQLTLHADRGTPTCSKPVAMLLADSGDDEKPQPAACQQATRRPEAQFKTRSTNSTSRCALTPSKTPVRSVRGSSPGTTTPIGTPGIGYMTPGGRAHRPGVAAARCPPTGARSGFAAHLNASRCPSSDPTRSARYRSASTFQNPRRAYPGKRSVRHHKLPCNWCSKLLTHSVRATMVEDPAHYRCTSYRANALGQTSPLLIPHSVYRSLGVTDKARHPRDRQLFR